MSYHAKVVKYREHLSSLDYPEYALHHANEDYDQRGSGSPRLDLSLWHDTLPPGIAEAALQMLPQAVGSYAFAQDNVLIDRLATRLGVDRENIIITAGADDALRIASHYCLRPGTKVLIPLPCFGRYVYHALVQNARIHYVRFDTYPYEFDVAQICRIVNEKKIHCLYVASPNNPTGHALSQESIAQLLESAPCSVILDEALLLTADGLGSAALVNTHPDLYVCGSFSKLYGLAGLRMGYLVARRADAAVLRKLVSPFSVDALALELAKQVLAQEAMLRKRISAITDSITALRAFDHPLFKVTRTSAPVALIEYNGSKGSLHKMLSRVGVDTVASEELPGLNNANAVRVIIKSVQDVLQLTRILTEIS